MYQLEKMTFIGFLLNILKPNFQTYDWFCADWSQIRYASNIELVQDKKTFMWLYIILTLHAFIYLLLYKFNLLISSLSAFKSSFSRSFC